MFHYENTPHHTDGGRRNGRGIMPQSNERKEMGPCRDENKGKTMCLTMPLFIAFIDWATGAVKGKERD